MLKINYLEGKFIVEEIISYSHKGCKYLKIENADGKVWLIPFFNVRKGMELYQPSSLKGRLLKNYLCYFKYIPRVLKKIGITICYMNLSERFRSKMVEVFECDSLLYAIFLGTPGKDNKPTIQVFTRKRILGYCKYTPNIRIANSFSNEKQHLDYLYKKNVFGVPQSLYCGELNDNIFLFVQDTTKSFNALILHELSKSHVTFLRELKNRTLVKCRFEDTEYYGMLQRFKKNLIKTPFSYDDNLIKEMIKYIENQMCNQREYCFYHGDFTPWNTYSNNRKEIYAFDLEYAKYSYPPMLDVLHFYTQVKLYESRVNTEEIYNSFCKLFEFGDFSDIFDYPDFSYLLYLIDIINFYIERDFDHFSKDTLRCLDIRYKLLYLCYNSILEQEMNHDCGYKSIRD